MKTETLNPRQKIKLPANVWQGFLDACQSYQKGHPKPAERFRSVPATAKVLEEHIRDKSETDIIEIEGKLSSFVMLAELALVEKAWGIGKLLVEQTSARGVEE